MSFAKGDEEACDACRAPGSSGGHAHHHHGHSHGHAIDDLAYRSHLRYVNAGEKFALATLTLVVLLVSRSIAAALVAMVAMGALTVGRGGIPLRRYVSLMLIPFLFLVVYVLVIGTAIRETPLELFAVRFGPGTSPRAGTPCTMQRSCSARRSAASPACTSSRATPR